MALGIAYTVVFGKPLIFWVGIATLTLLVATVVSGRMALKGKVKFKWHMAFVGVTLVIAAVHATLGILAYL